MQTVQHYWSAKLHFFPIFRTHIVRNCLSYWVQLVIYLNSNDKHAAKKNLFKFNIFFDQKMLQFFSFKFWKIWKWGIHRTIQSSKKMNIIYKYIFWKMHMYVFFKREKNSNSDLCNFNYLGNSTRWNGPVSKPFRCFGSYTSKSKIHSTRT